MLTVAGEVDVHGVSPTAVVRGVARARHVASGRAVLVVVRALLPAPALHSVLGTVVELAQARAVRLAKLISAGGGVEEGVGGWRKL